MFWSLVRYFVFIRLFLTLRLLEPLFLTQDEQPLINEALRESPDSLQHTWEPFLPFLLPSHLTDQEELLFSYFYVGIRLAAAL